MTDYLIHVKKQGSVGYRVSVIWSYRKHGITTFVENKTEIRKAINRLLDDMEKENV